jgi:hypothetical protein
MRRLADTRVIGVRRHAPRREQQCPAEQYRYICDVEDACSDGPDANVDEIWNAAALQAVDLIGRPAGDQQRDTHAHHT